jgi:hypothetical protein
MPFYTQMVGTGHPLQVRTQSEGDAKADDFHSKTTQLLSEKTLLGTPLILGEFPYHRMIFVKKSFKVILNAHLPVLDYVNHMSSAC